MPPNNILGVVLLIVATQAVQAATPSAGNDAAPVTIAIDDPSPSHVHPPGAPFTLSVRIAYRKPATVYFQWRDFRGRPLTNLAPIAPGTARVVSPQSDAGYFGLVFRAEGPARLPEREVGEEREYGFVIAPPDAQPSRVRARSPFGLVHAALDDPCVPAWVKTATWQTYSAETWRAEMDRRRKAGASELPLVLEAEWESDDTRAIGDGALRALEARLRRYLVADPTTRYWELGLEENLGAHYREPYYWSNLAAKAAAARRAAGPDVRFIYQIAELDLEPVQRFLASPAAARFDVLALHPYAWPDFPTPERWLGGYIRSVRAAMRRAGTEKPIWFTEVGAPHHGNAPGRFFGYPESHRAVRGLSPAQLARYLIKLHVLALHDGVEKIFWYNFRDQGPQRDQAEQHFGLRDYWGFPRPAYAAWCHMQRALGDTRPAIARESKDGLWIRAFDNSRERIWVLWTYPERALEVALPSLDPRLTKADVVGLRNSVGTPISMDAVRVPVGPDPVYLVTRIPGNRSR
jgi:hypothetical protein